MKSLKIPEATVVRLSVYSRYLDQVDKRGLTTISSGEIAKGVGVSAAQVRKDLAYFGEFGTRGVGYNVKELHGHIMKILGLTATWPVVIVGAGNLGTALSMYGGFRERGFHIRAIFDNDPAKIGYRLDGIEIYHINRLPEIVKATRATIGIICVPADQAQEVANALVEAGIRGILNFAPRLVLVPEHVELRNVDLSVNLEVLSFNLALRRSSNRLAGSVF
ncbi:MAG: redox-sensing transcriptional repressor Rex [Clostridia bacterium]|nr:redox-sensing transcriptional repressor Rex [Clostridia bacterium]